MKRRIPVLLVAMLALGYISCTQQNNGKTDNQKADLVSHQSEESMKTHVSIFEIPATDISRAIEFYQSVLNIQIQEMKMPGFEMGLFPYEGHQVVGVIMKGEGYQPSATGVTIYLNAGDDLQAALDMVEQSGGSIMVPKTPHADESGFFALFLDSEGNKMGLHSPN